MAKSKRERRKKRTAGARRQRDQADSRASTRKRRSPGGVRRVLDQKSRLPTERKAGSRDRREQLVASGLEQLRRWGRRVSAQWRRLPAAVRSPLNLALGGALALLGAVLVVLLLVRGTPGYYRDPDTISDEQLIQWGEGFVRKANDLLTHIVNKEEFDVTITEEELNGYLASFFRPQVRRALSGRLSEEYRLELPPGFRGLMVHLREGEVVLMARYEGSRLRPLVSVVGVPGLDDEGRVHFEPPRVRAGWLPVGAGWVAALEQLENESISLSGKHIRLERIEVHEGELRVVGRYESSGDRGVWAPPR